MNHETEDRKNVTRPPVNSTLIAQEHTRAHTSSPPHVSLHLRIRAGRFESVTGVEIYEASMYEDLSAKVLIFPLLC